MPSEPWHPKDFDVRSIYIQGRAWDGPDHEEESEPAAEFDRWLEQVKADAWDEGKRTGLVPNPYRKEQDDAD